MVDGSILGIATILFKRFMKNTCSVHKLIAFLERLNGAGQPITCMHTATIINNFKRFTPLVGHSYERKSRPNCPIIFTA
jgi:hypothetical protein